jgi:hypothetical protein
LFALVFASASASASAFDFSLSLALPCLALPFLAGFNDTAVVMAAIQF